MREASQHCPVPVRCPRFLVDPAVTDVLVNGVDVWIDRGAGLVRGDFTFSSDTQVRRLAQRLAAACGRRLDEGSPYVDARLPDGTRLHAVLPPVATDGPYLSLRTFRQRAFSPDRSRRCRDAVRRRRGDARRDRGGPVVLPRVRRHRQRQDDAARDAVE